MHDPGSAIHARGWSSSQWHIAHIHSLLTGSASGSAHSVKLARASCASARTRSPLSAAGTGSADSTAKRAAACNAPPLRHSFLCELLPQQRLCHECVLSRGSCRTTCRGQSTAEADDCKQEVQTALKASQPTGRQQRALTKRQSMASRMMLSAGQRTRPWASASTAEPPSVMRIRKPAMRQSPAPQQFTT